MSLIVRVAEEADLVAADRLLQASFERPTSFLPQLKLHRQMEPARFWVAECQKQGDGRGQIVGTVGMIHYGPINYLGLMAVDPVRQRQGIARRLIEHVLGLADAEGSPIVLLDATDKGAPLYEQYGFVDDGPARVFERVESAAPKMPPELSLAFDVRLEELIACDAAAFGADRTKLLTALWREHREQLLAVRDSHGELGGYLFARNSTLGPWVARDRGAAETLLRAALTRESSAPPQVMVPRGNDCAAELVTKYGFEQRRLLRHMRRGGQAPPGIAGRLFGQSSFTHG